VVQAAATSSFEWRGLRTTLPLEKLRVPLHAAKELAAGLSSAMDTGLCLRVVTRDVFVPRMRVMHATARMVLWVE
jgi:hypothetical protein